MIERLCTAARRLRLTNRSRRGLSTDERARNHHPADDPIYAARTARAIAQAMQRANERRDLTALQELAEQAMPFINYCPELRVHIARVRLTEGRPEQALALVDRDRPLDDASRLMRIVCQLQTNRQREAHIDLIRWNSLHNAPLAAQMLLTLLEGTESNSSWTNNTPIEPTGHNDVRRQPAALITAMCTNRAEQAASTARDLAHRIAPVAMDPVLIVMMRSLRILPPAGPDATKAQCAHLADELARYETAIAPLIEAQRHQPQYTIQRLLLGAIDQALPRLADPVAACQQVVNLLIERGEHDEAREWIIRGVDFSPMSLTMRLLEQRLDADTGSERTGRARDVLGAVGRTEPSATPATQGKAA